VPQVVPKQGRNVGKKKKSVDGLTWAVRGGKNSKLQNGLPSRSAFASLSVIFISASSPGVPSSLIVPTKFGY